MKDHSRSIRQVMVSLVATEGQLTETQAAKITGRSSRRFRGVFKEVVGETYRLVRVRIKMRAARKQLIDTNDSILTVASRFGYARRDKFENAFKKEFGVTPARYRALTKIFVNDRSGDLQQSSGLTKVRRTSSNIER